MCLELDGQTWMDTDSWLASQTDGWINKCRSMAGWLDDKLMDGWTNAAGKVTQTVAQGRS